MSNLLRIKDYRLKIKDLGLRKEKSKQLINISTMKRILLMILMAMPLMAMAQKTDDSKYLKGAVPEVDGIITFSRSFDVTGKTQAEVYASLQNVVKTLVANGRQDLRTRVVSDENNMIVARVEEIMTFKKKFLNWDHTYFRYLITAQAVSATKAEVVIKNISYHYGFDQEGNGGEEYKAEEWISDKEAINKAGTKLYPRSSKFRRKTVDRVDEIFGEFAKAL